MRTQLLLGVLLFPFLACVPSGPMHSRPLAGVGRQCVWPTQVYCDDDLEPAMCQAVEAAVELWNDEAPILGISQSFFNYAGPFLAETDNPFLWTGGSVYFTHDGNYLTDQNAGADIAQSHLTIDPQTSCRRFCEIDWVLDPNLMTSASVLRVTTHELGHALGLPDIATEGCVMDWTTSVQLTEAQTLELCESEENLLRALYSWLLP